MKQYHKNPRQISKKQLERLEGSLEELGDLSGVVHDLNSDEIIGGNMRSRIFDVNKCQIEFSKKFDEPLEDGTVALGYIIWNRKWNNYRQVRWTARQCERANLAANSMGGTWDWSDLPNWNVDTLTWAGFDKEMWNDRKKDVTALGEFLKSEAPSQDAEPETDRAAELLEKWQVKPGDMFQIGEHRLICGDCTDAATVARVMGGEKAGACVTDSPYGINREGIENDDPEGLRALFDGCLAVMPIENGVVINFQSPRLYPVWVDAIRQAGHEHQRALWFYDETDVTFPWRGWLMCSQIAIVSSIGKPEWSKDNYHHDCYIVKTAGKQDDSGGHTTAKPLDIVQDLVAHLVGDVYEPFSGSGTTLVACQNLGRKCRAVEISPAYVAVSLERMSTAFPDLSIHRIE